MLLKLTGILLLTFQRLHELLNGEGVAILEESNKFGGGRLQNYGINANTSANSFLRPFFVKQGNQTQSQNNSPKKEQKEEKEEKEEEEKEEDEEEVGAEQEDSEEDEEEKNIPKATLPAFQDLYPNSELVKTLTKYGRDIPPLSMIGMLLNFTGNHLLHYIHQIFRKQIFYSNTTVTGINLLQNGEVMVNALRQIQVVEKKGSNTVFTKKEQVINFRAKSVVLSQGALPFQPANFFKTMFPALQKEKVVLGDAFLQKEVFKQKIKELKEIQESREDRKLKIVIVGGSHSGFSAAWMLMNGPATYSSNNIHADPKLKEFPKAQIKKLENCERCFSKEENKSYQCDCLGHFSYKEWEVKQEDLPEIQEASIKILHRGPIKVFYNTVQTAINDGYTEYKPQFYKNKNGYLYSFTGLRGDARRLYYNMRTEKEKRVQLVKCENEAQQAEQIKDADLVIWACGYTTKPIPIKGVDGKVLQPQQIVSGTQNNCDYKCRLLLKEGGTLVKVFGTGIAYPVKTNDGMTTIDPSKPHPRADSFTLYLNFVANTILKQILPKNQLMNKLHVSKRDVDKKKLALQKLQEKKQMEEEKKARMAKASHYSNFVRKKTMKREEEKKKEQAKKQEEEKKAEGEKEKKNEDAKVEEPEKNKVLDANDTEVEVVPKQTIPQKPLQVGVQEKVKQEDTTLATENGSQPTQIQEDKKEALKTPKPLEANLDLGESSNSQVQILDQTLEKSQQKAMTTKGSNYNSNHDSKIQANQTINAQKPQSQKQNRKPQNQSSTNQSKETQPSMKDVKARSPEKPFKKLETDLSKKLTSNSIIKKSQLQRTHTYQKQTVVQTSLIKKQQQQNKTQEGQQQSEQDDASRNYQTISRAKINLIGDSSPRSKKSTNHLPKVSKDQIPLPASFTSPQPDQDKKAQRVKSQNQHIYMTPQTKTFKKTLPKPLRSQSKAFCLNNGYVPIQVKLQRVETASSQSQQRETSEQFRASKVPEPCFTPGTKQKELLTTDKTKVVPVKLFQIPTIDQNKAVRGHHKVTTGSVMRNYFRKS